MKQDCVIENLTLSVIYEALLYLEYLGFSAIVYRELDIVAPPPDLQEWKTMVKHIKARPRTVKIGLVDKYVQLHDAYLSAAEALRHAGFAPDSPHKVIDFMPGQSDEIDKGGTLRLGSYPCVIAPGTAMERCYGETQIRECHWHRYEFNNDFRKAL